jgi:hypothetical protein
MNDDDKQPSYERLDDTGQERNRRSFFDWLRGKEETEEERLRKKLDDELKEAARQRAEQFEEERREEEAREVAETKKLKKRWRAKLVEKSKSLLEDVAMSGEEPTSGYDIAKLMVAERIVKLDAMLHDESLDLRRSEVKSLKINIDFMGLLSEKLDRPELEVPKEIDQLYQTIAASVEETTGEFRPKAPMSTPETAPQSETDAAYNAFAASIVQAIRRTIRPENEPRFESDPSSSLPSAPESAEPAQTKSVVAEALLSAVKETALTGEDIRKELSDVDKARHLAEVVEKLEEKKPVLARAPRYTISSVPIPEPARRTNEYTENESEAPTSPNKKVKYFSDLELFTLAQTVKLDGGRLLSDVYTKGEIDRQDLIKVLEKFTKGEDFRSELTLRRQSARRRRESSQEYLAPSSSPAVAPQQPIAHVRSSSPPKNHLLGRRVTSLAIGPLRSPRQASTQPAAQAATPSTAAFTKQVTQRLRRTTQVATLAISVLLVVGLCVVVVALNTR